jgi:hypothetical protein
MNILDPIFYRTLFYDSRQWTPRDWNAWDGFAASDGGNEEESMSL